MPFIASIGTANPENRIPQGDIARFMVKAMHLERDQARRLNAIFRGSGIQHRHSVLADYGKQSGFTFFSENGAPFPSTSSRLKVYRQYALPLSLAAIKDCVRRLDGFNLKDITHLIVVSCTGMYAPGLDIEITQSLKLSPTVERTCINFMGCYAAFNALRVARAFCLSQPEARVLVVCTELCSLHFQRDPSDDNLLANALFADGAAALIMQNTPPQHGFSLEPVAFNQCTLPEGTNDMAWGIGDFGFEMKLSAYVPDVIRSGIRPLTSALLNGSNKDDIRYYAIHPGGRRILEAIEDELELTHEDNIFAYGVLKSFGNMSSPTVLFVLRDIMNALSPRDEGQRVLSFAFGPGLTLESALLRICHN